MHDIMRQIRG